jgi:hypothetical protein
MEVSDQLHAPGLLPPEKDHPVPTGQEAEWVPEPIWTLQDRENLAFTGNRTQVDRTVYRRYTDYAILAVALAL